MELRDLEVFVAVAEEQGVRAAASVLMVDPATISRAVGRLERHVGRQLVRRESTGVSLTKAGQLFLAEARVSLLHAGRAVLLAEHASLAPGQEGVRPVIVGFPPMPAVPAVSQVLAHVRRALDDRPYVLRRLSWRDDFSGDQVRAGNVDVAVSVLPGSAKDLAGVAISSLPRLVALPLAHELGRSRSITPDQLDGMKAVAASTLSGDALAFWTLDPQTSGRPRRLARRPKSVSDLLGQIADGQGFLTVPVFAPLMWQRSDLTLRRLDAPPCSVGLVWNPDRIERRTCDQLVGDREVRRF